MIDVGISFTAQPITVTPYDRYDGTTHRLKVGGGAISINIDPKTARQWITELTTITEEETK